MAGRRAARTAAATAARSALLQSLLTIGSLRKHMTWAHGYKAYSETVLLILSGTRAMSAFVRGYAGEHGDGAGDRAPQRPATRGFSTPMSGEAWLHEHSSSVPAKLAAEADAAGRRSKVKASSGTQVKAR
eukprot:6206033-Pleurochrysis_carterae.AAC.1